MDIAMTVIAIILWAALLFYIGITKEKKQKSPFIFCMGFPDCAGSDADLSVFTLVAKQLCH